MSIELKIPEVGESVSEAQIGRWLKDEGDRVKKDEPVVELETDKTDLELPAPADGVLSKIVKKQGDAAHVGDVIAYLDESGDGHEQAHDDADEKAKQVKETEEQAGAVEESTGHEHEEDNEADRAERDEASESTEPAEHEGAEAESESKPASAPAPGPQSKEEAKTEAGVDTVRDGGREEPEEPIEQDRESPRKVKVKPRPQPAPRDAWAEPFAAKADDRKEEAVTMSPIRKRIAQRLVAAQRDAALLTTFNEIDMSEVNRLRDAHGERFRSSHGVKLGLMSFFVKATVAALRGYPALNACVDDDRIVYRNYVDMGVAVSTERGLVAPIIRDAHRLSFAQIERRIADVADRARRRKLTPDELEGGTFTISNGGVFGSLLSTPIINPPQAGVLGMHAMQDRPVAIDGRVVIRPMMYVALTYDHRLVDGRDAVTFLRQVKEFVEDPARLLIDT